MVVLVYHTSSVTHTIGSPHRTLPGGDITNDHTMVMGLDRAWLTERILISWYHMISSQFGWLKDTTCLGSLLFGHCMSLPHNSRLPLCPDFSWWISPWLSSKSCGFRPCQVAEGRLSPCESLPGNTLDLWGVWMGQILYRWGISHCSCFISGEKTIFGRIWTHHQT